MSADLCVLTTYYNPQRYASRRRNYFHFKRLLDEAGAPCYTVECAFADEPFVLPESPALFRYRARSVLWQKERLINLAVRRLPRSIRKVAWVDADVIFENPRWFVETSELLDHVAVLQPFETVLRLPRGHDRDRGEGETSPSFCSIGRDAPAAVAAGWLAHGHTGYAWAARRELLEPCGLFDKCLTGSGDHLMAHGFLGDLESACVHMLVGLRTSLHDEYADWARVVSRMTGRQVGAVPGRVLHLWHGEHKDRRYHENSCELRRLDFVPWRDVRASEDGCLEWTGVNPKLEQWARRLFVERNEDGEGST